MCLRPAAGLQARGTGRAGRALDSPCLRPAPECARHALARLALPPDTPHTAHPPPHSAHPRPPHRAENDNGVPKPVTCKIEVQNTFQDVVADIEGVKGAQTDPQPTDLRTEKRPLLLYNP